MAEDINGIIRSLRNEAVERCKRRILDAARGLGKKPGNPGADFGLTSGIKRQYGL